MPNGLGLDHAALLLQIEQVDGSAVADSADLSVVRTIGIMDVGTGVLGVELSGLNVLSLMSLLS